MTRETPLLPGSFVSAKVQDVIPSGSTATYSWYPTMTLVAHVAQPLPEPALTQTNIEHRGMYAWSTAEHQRRASKIVQPYVLTSPAPAQRAKSFSAVGATAADHINSQLSQLQNGRWVDRTSEPNVNNHTHSDDLKTANPGQLCAAVRIPRFLRDHVTPPGRDDTHQQNRFLLPIPSKRLQVLPIRGITSIMRAEFTGFPSVLGIHWKLLGALPNHTSTHAVCGQLCSLQAHRSTSM
ncbi:hypothetical protein C2E23DRAFT_939290 [Lenzites betulinus]|nr:hypothetical protein C2E23DRAFT_939290 [Lenzites betulinus]